MAKADFYETLGVARGADVNAQSTHGCTALIYTAAHNHAGAAKGILFQ